MIELYLDPGTRKKFNSFPISHTRSINEKPTVLFVMTNNNDPMRMYFLQLFKGETDNFIYLAIC